MCAGFYPDGHDYDADKLREAADADDDPVSTHECRVCRDHKTHIESCPTSMYRWCPECEAVQQFVRLDRKR